MKKTTTTPKPSKNTLSDSIKTEPPLSEKDEVKNAETKMLKTVKK